MERVLLYWDDLDDLIGAVGLIAERLRNLALFAVTVLLLFGLIIGGTVLALTEPPLALAMAILLIVTLMYRTVTNPPASRIAA